MKVITFTSFKGGSGKTTTLMLVASSLVNMGKSVCLLEADENRPLTAWQAFGEKEGTWDDNAKVLIADDMTSLEQSFESAERSGFDYVLVDTHGGSSELNNVIISNSHFVAFPTSLTQLDVDETLKTYEYVATLFKQEGGILNAGVIKTRVPTKALTVTQKAVADVLNLIPCFEEPIYDRDAFASMKPRGLLHKTHKKYQAQKFKRLQANNYVRACHEADTITKSILDALED